MSVQRSTSKLRNAGISLRAEFYDVDSFTTTDTYLVTEGASLNRPWMCSCKAWQFARRDPATGFKKDCKHIRAVQLTLTRPAAQQPTKAHPAREAAVVDGEKFRVAKAVRPTPKEV